MPGILGFKKKGNMMKKIYCRVKQISKIALVSAVIVSTTVFPEALADVSAVSTKAPKDLDCIDFVGDGWKIQLPVESEIKAGSVKEVSPAELEAGYSDDYFFTAVDEHGEEAVVFHCPVEGYKTGNTTYARSELREMLDPDDKTMNWTWEGTHTLTTEQRVTHVPASGKVITSQIHGIERNGDNANPLVKVQYYYDKSKEAGSVNVFLKDTTAASSADHTYTFPNVALGQRFSTEIQVVDGRVFVTIGTCQNGAERTETYVHNFVEADSLWKDTLYYFKLGNYVQDSTDTGDLAYADVWVYRSDITHTEEVVKVPVERISMNQSDVAIRPGERTGLSVSVFPVKAHDREVAWSVMEGGDVIAIDKNGYITGVKEGKAMVRAVSISHGEATADCTVTVHNMPEPEAVELYSTDFETGNGSYFDTAFDTANVDVTAVQAENAAVAIGNESGNHFIKFVDESNSDPAKLSVVFGKQYQTTTISFRIRIDKLGEHKAGSTDFGCLYAVAAGADDWYGNTTELFRIRNNAKGTLDNFSELSYVLTNTYNEISMNADKVVGDYGDWVDVTYVVTPNDGTMKANTTDVYMNGYLVGSGISNRNSMDYVNRLDIHSGSGDKLDFSLDDIGIYSGEKIPSAESQEVPDSIELTDIPGVMGVQDSVKASVVSLPAESSELVNYSIVSGEAMVVSKNGYITAVKEGTAVVRVESAKDSSVFSEKTIRVKNEQDMTRVQSLNFNFDGISAKLEQEVGLEFSIMPADATEQGVKYEIISGDGVISVDSKGRVKGLAVGTAKVRITSLENPKLTDIITISVTNDLEAGTEIYRDGFEGSVLDNDHWTLSLAKDYTDIEVKDGSMTVTDANSANQPKAALSFEPACGKISMQFKIKVDHKIEIQGGEADSEYKNLRISFGNGKITTTENEAFCIRSNGTNFTYNVSGSDYLPVAGDYNVADWNTVTLVTAINAESNDTTDIYVNGVKLIENAMNKVDYAVIDKMCFSADTSKYAKYHIDDLLIWSGDYSDHPSAGAVQASSDIQPDSGEEIESGASNQPVSTDRGKSPILYVIGVAIIGMCTGIVLISKKKRGKKS